MGRACALAEVRHGHHVHHHTGPAGKVLCSLSLASVRVILLPSESSLLPLSKDIFNQILAQLRVHFPSLFLVRARSDSGILNHREGQLVNISKGLKVCNLRRDFSAPGN